MPGKFPNLAKGINPQMKEAERTSDRINPVKSMIGYSIINILKIKDLKRKTLKVVRVKLYLCTGVTVTIMEIKPYGNWTYECYRRLPCWLTSCLSSYIITEFS